MHDELRQQIIAEIYDATVAPERFEELLARWELSYVRSHEPGPLEDPGLQTHLRRAARVFDQMPSDVVGRVSRESVIDQLYPRLDVDSEGLISFANSAAAVNYGVRESMPFRELPFDAETLAELDRVMISRAPLTVSRRTFVDSDRSILLAFQGTKNGLSISTNELCWPDPLKERIRIVFDLSSAEIEVFRLLIRGQSPLEIASLRRRSLATIRTQIRSIYAKTSAHNQMELLRLTLSFAAMALDRDSDSELDPAHTTDPGAMTTAGITLPDGRWLAYEEFGDAGGSPVLLLHDEYYGSDCPAEMRRSARDQGLRVIVPARPYFGSSDPYPPNADPTIQFPEDVLALFHALKVDRFVILARRTGFRFGVYLAHMVPERVVGFVTQSPALPARSADDYAMMTPFARFISIATFRNPRLVEFIARVGVRHLQSSGLKRFARFINKGSEIDLAIVEDPAHWPMIRAGLEFGMQHGHLAYVHDLRHEALRTFEKAVNCPAHIDCLIGSTDPHDRLNRVQALIAAGADVSCEVVPDAGQMFFYTHPELIIDRVAAAWHRP